MNTGAEANTVFGVLSDGLIVAGGLLQVLGYVLLWRSLRDERQARNEYDDGRRHITGPIPTAFEPVFFSGSVGVSGGRQPTLEERVEGLEKRLAALHAELRSEIAQAREEAKETTFKSAESVRLAVMKPVGRIEALLDQMHEDHGRRTASVWLFSAGIVLSVAGSLV